MVRWLIILLFIPLCANSQITKDYELRPAELPLQLKISKWMIYTGLSIEGAMMIWGFTDLLQERGSGYYLPVHSQIKQNKIGDVRRYISLTGMGVAITGLILLRTYNIKKLPMELRAGPVGFSLTYRFG